MAGLQSVDANYNAVSFKADNKKGDKQNKPLVIPQRVNQQAMYDQYQKEQKQQKVKNGLLTALGVASSAVILAYFGQELIDRHKAKKAMREATSAISEAISESGASQTENEWAEALKKCKDKGIIRAIKEEFEKGPLSMSKKKINALVELAKIDESKLKVVDIENAKKILDDRVIGMQGVKNQVIEFLEYRNACIKAGIKPDKPLVIALDGPPGTAKTTLCKAVAEACGLPSKEISMAGATGKAKIIGNEPVYQGASWGEFADGQIEHKTKDLVYILDELEKTGLSEHNGKPDDALLSFLDGRHKGYDDFLGVDVDISNSIVMITTNDYARLSEPIRDRISYKFDISPYTLEEKAAVAKFKIGKALDYHKIKDAVILPNDIYDIIARKAKGEGGRDVTNLSENIVHKIFTMPENKGGKRIITSEMVNKWIDEASKAA